MLGIERVDGEVWLGVEREEPELAGDDLVAAERRGGGAERDLRLVRSWPRPRAAWDDAVTGPVDAAGAAAGRDVHQPRVLAGGHDPRGGAEHILDGVEETKVPDRDGLAAFFGLDGEGRRHGEHEYSDHGHGEKARVRPGFGVWRRLAGVARDPATAINSPGSRRGRCGGARGGSFHQKRDR